jgi:hypothetical protein
LQPASAVEESAAISLAIDRLLRSRFGVHSSSIFHAGSIPTCPTMTHAPTVVAGYASWAKMPPRCWSEYVHASRLYATSVRR